MVSRLRCGGPKSGQAPWVNLDGLHLASIPRLALHMPRISNEYDAIIIGLGISTGPVLDELLEACTSRKILVLERNALWNPEKRHEWPTPERIEKNRCLETPLEEDYVTVSG